MQAGYNNQWGLWVLGLEGDVAFFDASNTIFHRGAPSKAEDSVRVNLDTLATLRVRGAANFGRFFVFGTGGAAWADAEWTDCDCDDTGERGSLDFRGVRVAYGGGVEVALAAGWSIKAEGLFLDFDDKKDASNLTEDSRSRALAKFNNVAVWRVDVNYHFSGI